MPTDNRTPDTTVREVRADSLSLFDRVLTTSALGEVRLRTVVALRAINEDVEFELTDGEGSTTEVLCSGAQRWNVVEARS